jgi:hypothetical protein
MRFLSCNREEYLQSLVEKQKLFGIDMIKAPWTVVFESTKQTTGLGHSLNEAYGVI